MKPGVPNQERLLRQIVEDKEKFLGDRSKDRLRAYVKVFDTPYGRQVLSDLHASYGGISFVPGYADVTAFKEGRRSVADDIEQILMMARTVLQPEE